MSRFLKSSRSEQDLKWANIWHAKLATFHQQRGRPHWRFIAEHVIEFLKTKRDSGVPGWKRMKIIEALMAYRRCVLQETVDDLKPLRNKMIDIITVERARDGGVGSIEDVVGKSTHVNLM